MFRTIAFALLLFFPGVARADMAVFPQRYGLPIHVTFTIERDCPDYEFFLVDREKVQRVSMTPTAPLILKSEDRGGHIFDVGLFVVPKTALVEFDQAAPPVGWFKEQEHQKYSTGTMYERNRVDFYDNRERIEKSFRVIIMPDSCRLELLSANEGNPWVKRAWGGICCVLPPAAIVLSVIWLLRRLYRNWKGP